MSYNRHVQKFLTDTEFEDFLCKIVSYLDVWETVIGATYMQDLNSQLAWMFLPESKSPAIVPVSSSYSERTEKFA